MEEHQLPVQEEPVIVASNKKHSWSKKERLALYVAGVFALVGIGFGGYTFYNQVIANAAGESLLGSDISVDLPQPNQSAYFTVSGVGRENIAITPTGEASAQPSDGVHMNAGWRIEQSTDPTNDASWINVMDGTKSGYGITTNACYRQMYWSKDQTIAPNTTYYFRASKLNASTNQWEAQGSIVNVTTAADPVLTVTNTNGQVAFAWTGDVTEPYSCKSTFYYIARGASAEALAKVTDSDINWQRDLSYSASTNIVVKPISNSSGQLPLAAGTFAIAQPKNTSFFYTLLRYDHTDGFTTYAQVGPAQLATTMANANLMGAAATLTGTGLLANNFSDANLTMTVKNSASLAWSFASSGAIKTWSPKTTTKYGSDCIISFNSSDTTNNSQSKKSYDSCQNAVPGSYTIKSFVSAHPQSSEDDTLTEPTNDVVLTLGKVAPSIQINYLFAGAGYPATKAGKDVKIAIYNAKVYGYAYLPEGQLIVTNIKTGKVLKTVTLGTNTTSTNITLKKLKKGKYNLSVTYKASSTPSIFQDKTVNLPLLTVK